MDGDEWADGTFSIKIGEYGYVYASLRKEDLPDNMCQVISRKIMT
ncbi:hypothetical protein JCM19236_442 [Vibrio sp. JCM 19236]|nr:hypothetical protein JCM19236_442 [Vibrio sp. JCM 19236]